MHARYFGCQYGFSYTGTNVTVLVYLGFWKSGWFFCACNAQLCVRLKSCSFSAVEHSKITLSYNRCFAVYSGLFPPQMVQRYERLPTCWSSSVLCAEWWVWLWTSQGTEHDLRLSWVQGRFTGTANLCCFTVTWRVSGRPFLNNW